MGALIITPTRELAIQIFDELRKVGKHHDFSAGLLIGGKNIAQEKLHLNGEGGTCYHSWDHAKQLDICLATGRGCRHFASDISHSVVFNASSKTMVKLKQVKDGVIFAFEANQDWMKEVRCMQE